MKCVVSSLVILTSMVLFFGCAQKNSLEEKPALTEVKPQVPVKEAWEVEWEKTLKSARNEGRVVVWAATVAPALRDSIAIMKDKYGIDLELTPARGADIRARVLRERASGLFIPDILIAGAHFVVKSHGVLDPLEPALILPEIVNPKLWYEGRLPWADKERMIFYFLAYPTSDFGINTQMVKPAEVKSFHDLLDTKWKGKLVMNDPTITGSALNSFSTYLYHKVLDADFFRQLVRQEPVILRDQRLQVDWLARGRYPVAVWPQSSNMAEYQKAGAPVAEVMIEGAYFSVDGASLGLVNRAPHPNAARIFINWLLSREGQIIIQKTLDMQSAREDIGIEGLNPAGVRKPGQKYLVGANNVEEWVLKEQDQYVDLAKKIFEPALGR